MRRHSFLLGAFLGTLLLAIPVQSQAFFGFFGGGFSMGFGGGWSGWGGPGWWGGPGYWGGPWHRYHPYGWHRPYLWHRLHHWGYPYRGYPFYAPFSPLTYPQPAAVPKAAESAEPKAK
jgi:hypothetical protein